jgi:hypothetical protein
MRITLASGTVVHDLVTEDIAVDAEMLLARFALIPTRLAGTFGSFRAARARVVD